MSYSAPGTPTSGGAGFSPQYVQEFAHQIEAIKIAVEQTSSVLPKEIAALTKSLNDSLHEVWKGGPSRPDAGERTKFDYDNTSLKKALPNQPGGRPTDLFEEQIDGRGQRQASQTGWRGRTSHGDNILPLPRFPGAEPNPADLLNYMGTVSANIAQKRQNVLDRRTIPQRQEAIAKAVALGQIKPDQVNIDEHGQVSGEVPEALQNRFNDLNPDTRLGKVSDLFHKGESAYSQGRYIQGIARKIFRPFHQAGAYGYQTGYEGSPAGFMGMRSPLSDATISGFGQRASQMGLAINEGVTPKQSHLIYDQLFSRGWYGGSSTNNMRTAAGQMMNQNPFIASQPQYYDMMDKATRQGAMSLQGFNEQMKQIPASAKAAHVSMEQTMADMDALGQANKQAGGTYAGGIKNANAWQQITGMPSSIMGTLMQNPMVKGQTFMQTGLMPWQQGLASPYQHMRGISSSLGIYNQMIRNPGDKTQKDAFGGSSTITGQSQKEALMAHLMGVSPEVVHTMLNNQKGWNTAASIGEGAQNYENRLSYFRDHQGHSQEAWNELQGSRWSKMRGAIGSAKDSQGHKVFEDWGYYNKLREKPGEFGFNPGGIFGKQMSTTEAHRKAQQKALDEVQYAGQDHALKGMNYDHLPNYHIPGVDQKKDLGKLSSAEKNKLIQRLGAEGKLSDKTKAEIAQARNAKIKQYQQDNTNRFGSSSGNGQGPQLRIELGPAAKKVLHMSDPNNQQKANQNAGAVNIDQNSFAGGPTASPTPNLDTASGAPDYGSQYNTGGP